MLRLPFSSQRSSHRYEPLPNSSADDVEHGNVTQPPKSVLQSSWIYKRISPRRRLRSVLRLTAWLLLLALLAIVLTVVCESTFSPSYTHPPSHYTELRLRAKGSTAPGRANPNGEKVFIAASLLEKEGHLTSGPWGEAVLQLVDLLGHDNVHLSIYENDVDNGTSHSLNNFRSKAKCNHTILSEPLDLSSIPRVTVPTGESRLKRVAFLAEMRNRALAPLDSNRVRFDRLLYINDVIFDPIEAAQLLFATNIDGKGRADYAAACAVDFGNAFKFYDRFATRDLEGQITGLPFFPWFTDTGAAASRKAVVEGTDAVPVSSCWGGMTAFDAKWFQDMPEGAGLGPRNSTHKEPASPLNLSAPVRFRAETDTFWESSECCLIHADIQYRRSGQNLPTDSGIYMNPFIRVAYDQRSLSWLSLTRRPERLYGPIHSILNYFVGFPERQYRNHDQPGQLATQNIWVNNEPPPGGHFEDVVRTAQPGGYCSTPNLLLAMNETPEQGSGAWSKIEPWDYQI